MMKKQYKVSQWKKKYTGPLGVTDKKIRVLLSGLVPRIQGDSGQSPVGQLESKI